MKRAKLIGLVAVVLLLVTLVWQNRGPVETKILFTTVSMPGALLLFLTSAAGFLAGVLASLLVSRKSRQTPQDAKAPMAQPAKNSTLPPGS